MGKSKKLRVNRAVTVKSNGETVSSTHTKRFEVKAIRSVKCRDL